MNSKAFVSLLWNVVSDIASANSVNFGSLPIGTVIITIHNRILVISLAGEYGDELEQMVFNDESTDTDYLDCVKFCADLVWHGRFLIN